MQIEQLKSRVIEAQKTIKESELQIAALEEQINI